MSPPLVACPTSIVTRCRLCGLTATFTVMPSRMPAAQMAQSVS